MPFGVDLIFFGNSMMMTSNQIPAYLYDRGGKEKKLNVIIGGFEMDGSTHNYIPYNKIYSFLSLHFITNWRMAFRIE